jgi:hypothetical protein
MRPGVCRRGEGLAGAIVADEGEEDALDGEFAGGNEVGVGGVFRLKVGATGFDDVAFECGFAVDEGGDDVVAAGFLDFEDDVVAIEDVGIDHGVTPDAEGEGAGGAGDAEGIDVDGDGAFLLGFDVDGVACGNGAEDRDVEDFGAVEVFGEDDGAGHVGVALDDAFFLEGAEVAHGGGLAGEAEVPLDFTCGGHDAIFTLVLPEKVEQLALPVRE